MDMQSSKASTLHHVSPIHFRGGAGAEAGAPDSETQGLLRLEVVRCKQPALQKHLERASAAHTGLGAGAEGAERHLSLHDVGHIGHELDAIGRHGARCLLHRHFRGGAARMPTDHFGRNPSDVCAPSAEGAGGDRGSNRPRTASDPTAIVLSSPATKRASSMRAMTALSSPWKDGSGRSDPTDSSWLPRVLCCGVRGWCPGCGWGVGGCLVPSSIAAPGARATSI